MSDQYKPMKEKILHGYFCQIVTYEICDESAFSNILKNFLAQMKGIYHK
jgi:hypothetical protein